MQYRNLRPPPADASCPPLPETSNGEAISAPVDKANARRVVFIKFLTVRRLYSHFASKKPRVAKHFGYNKSLGKGMQINVGEARDKLTQLLQDVENGEEVTICRNGKPVADLVPTKSSQKERPK
jgi:prevent-host-death family protein